MTHVACFGAKGDVSNAIACLQVAGVAVAVLAIVMITM
jgi:hypothetical protein